MRTTKTYTDASRNAAHEALTMLANKPGFIVTTSRQIAAQTDGTLKNFGPKVVIAQVQTGPDQVV